MLLTKTTEYAVRVLIFMAYQDKDLFTAKHIHEKLKIPYKYLTRIMTNLAKKGYLESIRGRAGGFKFQKKLDKITLLRIIDAVEGLEGFDKCILGLEDCTDENPCALHYVWEKTKQEFIKNLSTTTLADLVSIEIKKF